MSIGYVDKYRQQEHNVPFPIYPMSDLSAVARKWQNVINMGFKAKGAFLAHPEITARHVPGILELSGSIVAFDSSKKTNCFKEMKLLCDILPTSFFIYAVNCCIDSGYRLLQHCIHHATDSRFPRNDKEIATLINHNGELGIYLCACVPALMKNCSYLSEIVLTPTKILCCKCTCQCGSQNNERMLCVHNLPLLYSMTILLFASWQITLLGNLLHLCSASYGIPVCGQLKI